MLRPQLPVVTSVEKRSLDELYSYAEGFLNEIEKHILLQDDKLKALEEEKERLEGIIDQVTYLQDFLFDLADLGESEYLVMKAGKTTELPAIEQTISSHDQVALYSKQFGTGKKKEWAVVIVSHISEKEIIEKICREKLIVFDIPDLSGTPQEGLKTLKNKQTRIDDEKKDIMEQLRTYADHQLHDLLALREEIQLERVKKEVPKNFAKTDTTYVIEGWVLEENEAALQALVTKITDGHLIFSTESPSINPDNPPIYLKTPRWATSFRTFLELFATPKYSELNPTVFMGIFFILFFGVMLGDAGYGLIILILALVGYFKYGKFSPMIRNWSFLGIWLGTATTVVGFLTNGFFGDLIPRFIYLNGDKPLYSATLFGIQLPLEPIKEPLTILTIALVFGIIHLNLGIILGIIQAYHRRDYKALLTKHFNWIPLQIGGGLLIGNFIMGWTIQGLLFYVATALTLLGVILLFVDAGPIGFFGLTGYVGDWLSYARLLALGLATAGMALAFNVVSELIGGMIPIIGVVIIIILLVVSHMINLALQALGAGVHALRLQYVEFFNRFYEGGGKQFSPFKIRRKFTKVEEKTGS